MEAKPKILIVDDLPQNLYVLDLLLADLDVEVIQAANGPDALALALENDFCVAIIDIQMPEMSGYELVELLRGNASTASLPVIFVSAVYSDERYYRKAYDTGAVDFMSKPYLPGVLISKVKVFVDLYNQRRRLEMLVEDLNRANTMLYKRALQIETSSQVGQQVVSLLDLDALLTTVVRLIRERFGYYSVNVWLADALLHEIVLSASSHMNREIMLRTRIALNQRPSILAHVMRSRQFYLAENTLNDSNYEAVEWLPETRSELSLPLLVQQEFLGILDLQSNQVNGFSSDDIPAFRIMADQLAIAVRNARTYQQLVNFNVQLESVSDEMRTFAYAVSHELRSPLRAIDGYSRLLLAEYAAALDPQAQSFLEKVRSSTLRMNDLIDSVLHFSRLASQSLARQNVSMKESAQSALEEQLALLGLQFPDYTPPQVKLADLPPANADPLLIRQVFSNLINNAFKFSRMRQPPCIEIGFQEQEGQLVYFVRDNGIGFAQKDAEFLFGVFYRLNPSEEFEGAGIGLANTRRIIERHGGRIWAEGIPDTGAVFYFTL